MNYYQGDIVLITFPNSNLAPPKVRPAVVISNGKVNKTADLILAQITSHSRNDEFSVTLEDKDVTSSLDGDSEIRTHKVFTADRNIIKKKISSIKSQKKKEEIYDKVCASLKLI